MSATGIHEWLWERQLVDSSVTVFGLLGIYWTKTEKQMQTQ